jgi:aryl-alcohol dehydrogenase-like predicted oxidoreductase
MVWATYINFTEAKLRLRVTLESMETVYLKGTDLKVSRACLGTMTFGSQANETESRTILDYALDHGINFIDTAHIYVHGTSEEILGKTLDGRRHQLILASKVRGSMGDGPLDAGLSHGAIIKALDDSLRRLRTDYLDLYYLHQPDYDVPLEETLKTLDDIIHQGKVRFAACSNYASWQVCQMHSIADKHAYQPVRVTQPMYNLLARGVEQEFLPMARQFDVSVIAYNPLAGGLLTGKHSNSQPAEGSRFVNNQVYRDRYWRPEYFEAVRRLESVAANEGRALASMALNWLFYRSGVACIVLGASRQEQLAVNLLALEEGALGPEAIRECDRVWDCLRGCAPQYNR